MMRYRYEAVNAEQSIVSGEIEAESVLAAAAQLESQGLTLRAIERVSEVYLGEVIATGDSTSEQTALEQHWQHVFERAKMILPALQAFAHDMPAGRRRRQLQTVVQILERGNAADATAALATLPGYWIPLLSAAASSRDPGRLLREFLQETQRAEDLYRQWWATLAYPVCLLLIATVVLVAMSYLIVPVFSTMFREFQLNLPLVTRVVITVSDWIVTGRILLLLLAGTVALGVAWLICRCLPAPFREWFSDRWPLCLGRGTAIARFSRFTADLFDAELPLAQAIRLAGLAVGNGAIQRASRRVALACEGGSVANQPENARVLTHAVLSVIDSSLPRQSQTNLLREIGACYADRVQLRLSWTHGIIEPIAICLVGLLVGVIVLALFMPLVSLISNLSG